ncbi:hypothetical protein M011DRAFT_463164 [Sporormia fimetaria CBS 119925]|uniref:Peptidase S54 rhomboid domain-containing protein n=1 Tax=Sporormia fimetaria CBS 119925 TaxID=1340428 RepID=A0A6A6VPF0_9PLEO|nr:hypothetical protein M011DRAFT_463164 [Sporormia fimetaria CBS 119925]
MSLFFCLRRPFQLQSHRLNPIRRLHAQTTSTRLSRQFFAFKSPQHGLSQPGHQQPCNQLTFRSVFQKRLFASRRNNRPRPISIPKRQPATREPVSEPEPEPYQEPEVEQETDPSSKLKGIVIWGFIGINVAIFLWIQFAKLQNTQGNKGPMSTIVANFPLSLRGVLKEKRYSQLLASMFTHFDVMHLAFNMFAFHAFASLLKQAPFVSAPGFATLVIGSGLFGGVAWLVQRFIKLQQTRKYEERFAVGFSGAVMGVGAAAAMIAPRAQMLLMGVLPVPMWLLVGGYLAYDGVYLSTEGTGTAHAGHLGGLAFGFIYYLLFVRRGKMRYWRSLRKPRI